MSGLFGSPKAAKPPKPEPPAAMPDPESPQVREAEKSKIGEIAGRGGRRSTILTQPFTTNSGFDSYNRPRTG